MPDRYHKLAGRIVFARGVPLITRPPGSPATPAPATPAGDALLLDDGSPVTDEAGAAITLG